MERQHMRFLSSGAAPWTCVPHKEGGATDNSKVELSRLRGLAGGNRNAPATALSDAMQQSYLLRTQALLAGAGAQRMVWFAWDLLHVSVHLTPFFGTGRFVDLTPAGQSWQVGYSWLNNTSVDKCVKNSAGVYSCVARGGGEVRRIYWRVSGTSTVAAPATSFSKEDVNGTPTAITPGTKLTITTSPIMVRATA